MAECQSHCVVGFSVARPANCALSDMARSTMRSNWGPSLAPISCMTVSMDMGMVRESAVAVCGGTPPEPLDVVFYDTFFALWAPDCRAQEEGQNVVLVHD